jgi:hypothetical protein
MYNRTFPKTITHYTNVAALHWKILRLWIMIVVHNGVRPVNDF